MQKIFIVEDDEGIRDMVSYMLGTSGFEASGFSNSAELWEAMRGGVPDLAILDIMLPGDEDGITILKRLRQTEAYKKVPVIMLTARGSELDRIKGLDLGADDYITKPFSVVELVSRVRAVLRRYEGAGDRQSELVLGPITLSGEKRQVLVSGEEVVLTFKEFELLNCLMLNAGIVMSRDKLLEQVWGFDYNGESRTVDMHIKTLRQKLGAGGESILTVRNIGYKMGN